MTDNSRGILLQIENENAIKSHFPEVFKIFGPRERHPLVDIKLELAVARYSFEIIGVGLRDRCACQ